MGQTTTTDAVVRNLDTYSDLFHSWISTEPYYSRPHITLTFLSDFMQHNGSDGMSSNIKGYFAAL